MIVWLASAVAWLRRWGGWVVGLVVAVIALVLGRRKGPLVPSEVQKKAEEEASAVERAADQKAQKEKQDATEKHEAGVASEVESERAVVASIDDPEQVNAYLKEAGESVKREGK